MRKVAVVETAQLPGRESGDNYLDQVFRVCRQVLDKAGLTRHDVGTMISATSDIFHGGVSCANAYYWDSGGALLKNGSRNDGESMTAFFLRGVAHRLRPVRHGPGLRAVQGL